MGQAEMRSYFEQATAEMQMEYDRIRRRTAEDPGTAGDEGEENWAEILRYWLPGDLNITTKGRVLCADGNATDQVDIAVFTPSYPRAMLTKKMHLASEALALFECKTTLKIEHIRDGIKRAARAKSMIYNAHGIEVTYGLVAHSHSWKSPRDKVIERISHELSQAHAFHVKHPNDQLDFVCIANFGMWTSKTNWDLEAWGEDLISYYSAPRVEHHQLPSGISDAPPIGRMISYILSRMALREERYRGLSMYFLMSQMESGGGSYLTRDIRHWTEIDDKRRKIIGTLA